MKNIKKQTEDLSAIELEKTFAAIKGEKEVKGLIPSDGKKIVIIDGRKDFSGKALKIQKGVFKNGQMYTYSAGTKWEELDAFAKKNIVFSEGDFV